MIDTEEKFTLTKNNLLTFGMAPATEEFYQPELIGISLEWTEPDNGAKLSFKDWILIKERNVKIQKRFQQLLKYFFC